MSGTTLGEEAGTGAPPRGVTPPSGRGGRLLGDVIVDLGFAEREVVEQAAQASRAPGKKIGSTLVEMGILSEQELGRAVAERHRLDYLDLDEFDVDLEAARVIDDNQMERYEAAPVAFTEDGALLVAMVDPADWLAAEEIAQLTGRRVRRAVASPAGVAQLIARAAEVIAGQERAGDSPDDGAPAPTRLALRRGGGDHSNRAGTAEPDRTAPDGGVDPSDFDLLVAATEREAVIAERARLDSELRATRAELGETRSELTTVRAWTDAALKRALEAERRLADARADVGRLEAELAAARDQAESLRGDLSWARRQIERKDAREDQALADLLDRVEAMHARSVTAADPRPQKGVVAPIAARRA